MPVTVVSEQDARGTRTVYGLLGDERFRAEADHARSLAPFRDLRDGDIVEVLYRLGLEALGDRSKIFSTEQPGDLAYEAHRALMLGLSAAEQWPGGFYGVLDSMRRRSASTTLAGLRKYVAPVERWLDQLPDDHGGVLREAVRAYRQVAEARAQRMNDESAKSKLLM